MSAAAGGKGGVEAEAVGRLVKQLGGGLRQLVFVSSHGALALPLTLILPLPWSSYPPAARCAISPDISRYLPYISLYLAGTLRCAQMPWTMRNLLGQLDKLRAAEQAISLHLPASPCISLHPPASPCICV